jgi:hypothetical protein
MRTELGDFTVRPRMLTITALALVAGGAGAVAAFALLRLIGFLTLFRRCGLSVARSGFRLVSQPPDSVPVGVAPTGILVQPCVVLPCG